MSRFVGRSLALIAGYPVLAAGFWLTIVLQLAYKLGIALCLRVVFDDGIIAGNGEALALALGGLVALLAVFAAASLVHERVVAELAMRITNRLRESLFSTYLSVSPSFHRRNAASSLISGIGSDVDAVELALVRGVPPVVLDVIIVVASIVLLFVVQWRLAAVALATVPLSVLASKPFQRRATARFESAGVAGARLLALTQEAVLGYLPVVIFRVQNHFIERFAATLRDLGQTNAQAHFFTGTAGRAAQVAAGIVQIVVIGFGAWLAYRGYMTAGLVIAFIALLSNAGDAIGRITAALPIAARGATALERVESLLDAADTLSGAADAKPLHAVAREIRFDHVSFGYAGSERILDDVSFTIPAGSFVGLIGPSGCGKSTVLALLMRLYRPDSGRILIDDRPIESITEDSLRSLITAVAQTPTLFAGTVIENIAIARPGAGSAEIEAAARRAAAHDMIRLLPEGYRSEVGPAGDRLSGGQRQRLAIARAFLRDAPILLLDEATSALDPVSEGVVNHSVVAMKGHRTTIAVTHRPDLLPDFDQILVFDRGRLVQQGRHAELISLEGVYRQLWSRVEGLEIDSDGQAAITVERLRQFAFLTHCAPETLAELASSFLPERYAEQREVMREGEPGDRFYVLARGVVEVLKDTADGDQVCIARLHDGDFFGEVALIADVPRTATIRTVPIAGF